MVRRYIVRFVGGILFLIFYFMIFIHFVPQIVTFVESFVTANSNIFKLTFKTTEFQVVNNTVTPVEKYTTIDFTSFLIFVVEFTIYVIIPLGAIFIMFRK